MLVGGRRQAEQYTSWTDAAQVGADEARDALCQDVVSAMPEVGVVRFEGFFRLNGEPLYIVFVDQLPRQLWTITKKADLVARYPNQLDPAVAGKRLMDICVISPESDAGKALNLVDSNKVSKNPVKPTIIDFKVSTR